MRWFGQGTCGPTGYICCVFVQQCFINWFHVGCNIVMIVPVVWERRWQSEIVSAHSDNHLVRQEAIPFILRSRLNCWNRAGHCGPVIRICPVRTSEGTPAVLSEVFVVLLRSLSSSSSCSKRGVRRVACSLILQLKLVRPSLLRSSYVPLSVWSVMQCLSW
jgi:hypothetical protein